MNKVDHSIELIRSWANDAKNPAVMWSAGKDSMVLADLIRHAFPEGLNGMHFPKAHAFPLPVIHYRDPWFPFKYDFANWVIKAYDMEVHDHPPAVAGVKTNDEQIELVARYSFGNLGRGIDLPKNVESPDRYPRRDYICGLNDWVMRPRMNLILYPWDLVFVGHKNSDVDPFEGPVPLKSESAMCDDVKLVFPLREWTDTDVWEYIEQNHIPFQGTRYKDRKDVTDTWYNADYVHACTRCIDPRCTEREVLCPKLHRMVPNVSQHVLQLHEVPDYVGEAA